MLIINIALTKARLRNLQFKIDMIIKEHQDIYFTSQSKNTHVPRLKVAFRGGYQALLQSECRAADLTVHLDNQRLVSLPSNRRLIYACAQIQYSKPSVQE